MWIPTRGGGITILYTNFMGINPPEINEVPMKKLWIFAATVLLAACNQTPKV